MCLFDNKEALAIDVMNKLQGTGSDSIGREILCCLRN